MNEAETRAEHIDPALKAAGWGVVDGSRIRREYSITLGRIEGQGRRGKPLIADYVLEYRNTKLAVVEAKAWDLPLTEGVGQAKDYAGKLAIRYTYASNGQGIYGIDMETGIEGELSQYPTPDELWNRTFATRNAWRDRFAAVPFEDRGGYFQGRYYQDIAIERVLAAIANNQQRILLTLATGTGKTFIAFQLAWKLFHSRWNLADGNTEGEPTRRPRILFLADRNILADQAYNAFSAFPDGAQVRIEPADISVRGRVPKNGSIFFTIFQTFMSGPPKNGIPSPYFGEYPPDFFDFIVIDECHRGGANDESNWRGILDYFAPAIQLGLTATPKRKDNVDTYAYFGEPVFVYSLKDGINDGFLTPFRVKQISTTLDEYVHVPGDGVVVKGELIPGKRYVEADFNRIISIPAREAYRIELFMKAMRPGEKAIVFCASQKHALEVRDLINQMKTSTDPNYCQRVTANDGKLGDESLRNFQDNEKSIPTILTTSKKLSTGVDARNVRNIVLMRPVTNMIEFKQIIGRGTRLYDGKDYFTIYDFVKAHHLFGDPEWDGEPVEPETCKKCGCYPCECKKEPPKICKVCNMQPCECDKQPCPNCGQRPCICPMVEISLSDNIKRSIKNMTVTSFWHPDGTPMSAQQFMEMLYGKLPEFFKNEAELRELWSSPDTRVKLLFGLAEQGFGKEQLLEMQKIIDAENSDLFDVLAHVAYALPPLTREIRATRAKVEIHAHFNSKQQVFLDFVLAHYVQVGVEELDKEKLTPLLRIKYHGAIADAVADLGKPEEIGRVFAGFQKYLYQHPE
jgi:type I restriction enzyme R subunit